MVNGTSQLTRRSFATWLTAGGIASTLTHFAVAQDSIEYEIVDLGLARLTESYGDPNESDLSAQYGQISLERRSRDGRPPSEWLRSMDTEELRAWLNDLEVTEAGVQGMTFWTHLTRDHLFQPVLIKGLTDDELAKLHAAAHFGY